MIRELMLLCTLAAYAAAQSVAEPQLALAGRTIDTKGQAVRKVSLILRPLETNAAGDPLAPYGVTSDTEGNFEFYGVRPGRYRLMAERGGYLKIFYGARNKWAPGAILTLRAGAPLTGVTVQMVEQAVLSGSVITDENASFWYVELFEQQYMNGKRRWASVNMMGTWPGREFSFNKLKAGRYRLAAVGSMSFVSTEDDPSGQRYVSTYYPGVTDPASAETIELRPGQTVSDMRLPRIKAPMSSLSGSIVRTSSASPAPMVYLSAVGSADAGSVGIVKDRLRVESLQAGSYILGVLDRRIAETRLLARQIVQVSGDTEAPPFDLDAIGLRGTVQAEDGTPARGKLRVKLIPVDDPTPYFAYAEVMADGTFAIPGTFIGPFRIEVEGLPAGAYLKSAVYGKKDAVGVLDLPRTAGDEKLAIVVGAAGAQISGAVRDEKGGALEGIVILVPDPQQPEKISLYRLAETGENGRFQFQGVAPGRYRLYGWEEFEAGAQFDPEVTAPFQARSVAIEVAEGERKEVTVPRIAVDEVEAGRKPE